MRVLVADDEHYIRDLLARSLRTWGYVTTAEDGAGAWDVLKHVETPRVFIVDWDMPGMSGPEVVRLLRNADHGHEVYVVMLTGRVKKTDLVEALEAGVEDLPSKPFDSRELQLRLARAMASRQERAAVHASAPEGPPSATTLGGRYRMGKRIGEGGMADVWLGTHLALEIPIAIKFMKPSFAKMPDYVSFEREAFAKDAALRFRDANELASSFKTVCAQVGQPGPEPAIRSVQPVSGLASTELLVAVETDGSHV